MEDALLDNVDYGASGFEFKPGFSFGYLLRDTSRLLLRTLSKQIERHGVTLGQYFLLRELWEEQGITQRQLSARVGILEPSTVSALDAMENLDLVLRVRSKQDRRKIHVYLTEKGSALRNVLLRYALQLNREALAGIPAEEVLKVREILLRVKANLAAKHDAP